VNQADSGRPARVRVTAPRSSNRRRQPRTAATEIDAQTEVGAIFVRSLLRAQLRAAAATLSLVVVLIGLLPLVFHQAPGLADQTLLGMPLPWVLLAFGIYPVLFLIGRWHVRRAERIEAAFADVVEGS
jgi:hypothetical protein